MLKNDIFLIKFKTYFSFYYKKTEISLVITSDLIFTEISLKIYHYFFTKLIFYSIQADTMTNPINNTFNKYYRGRCPHRPSKLSL